MKIHLVTVLVVTYIHLHGSSESLKRTHRGGDGVFWSNFNAIFW